MSLQLTNRVETPMSKRKYKVRKLKERPKQINVNNVSVGTLLKRTEIRETGKLMDLLTDAILNRIKRSSNGFEDVFGYLQKDPLNNTSYMSYDSFCKSCTNILRLNFSKAEQRQLFNAIDGDKNGMYNKIYRINTITHYYCIIF
jgi:hypothetical protein